MPCNEKEIKKNVFFGIELELEYVRNANYNKFSLDHLIKVFGGFDRFGLSDDGSLEDGIELKSAPMTYEEIVSSKNWDKLFSHINRTKVFLNKPKTAGMHIHVSKNSMSIDNVRKIAEFFANNKGFVFGIAERKENDFCYYEAEYGGRNRFELYDHSSAINISRFGTYEIRIFQSINDIKSFYKNLEFVKALIDYCNFYKKDKEITTKKLYSFIVNSGKYINLLKFINKNLSDYVNVTKKKISIDLVE